MSPLLALSLPTDEWLNLAVRWVAAVGAALVGGFVIGLATQALVGLLAAQKTPQPVVWLVRILGGIVCGWLTFLALAHWGAGNGPGGFGPGPGGLPGSGTGDSSKNGGTDTHKDSFRKPPDQPDTKAHVPPEKTDTVQLEILDPETVDRLTSADKSYGISREERFSYPYRLSDERGHPLSDRLLTRQQALDRITGQQDPKVRKVVVIQYEKGRGDSDPWVFQLFEDLKPLKGKMNIEKGPILDGAAKDSPPALR